ncbi:MAG: hypothetical protein AAF497_22520 [Planctomycetota bacterium]
MTHARTNLFLTREFSRGLLVFVVFATLTGCERRAYRITEETSIYAEENIASLNRFADLISAEPEIREIWCVPPATIDARNKDGGDWFALQGDKYQAYLEQCANANLVSGVYIDDGNPVIVLPTIPAGHSMIHHELIRPVSEEGKKQTCGSLSNLPFIDQCEMPLEVDGWTVRYRALSDEELERLRELME